MLTLRKKGTDGDFLLHHEAIPVFLVTFVRGYGSFYEQLFKERKGLVFRPVFKTGSRRIKPAVAGSIPALSAFFRPMNNAMTRI